MLIRPATTARTPAAAMEDSDSDYSSDAVVAAMPMPQYWRYIDLITGWRSGVYLRWLAFWRWWRAVQ